MTLQVRIPMMPKGVEHVSRDELKLYMDLTVRIPMMPKGVEHRMVEFNVRIPDE